MYDYVNFHSNRFGKILENEAEAKQNNAKSERDAHTKKNKVTKETKIKGKRDKEIILTRRNEVGTPGVAGTLYKIP
jgi:hypothetical protein